MKVLDLFSGLGGWSAAFKDRGHTVITVDNNPKFNPTICADINNLDIDRFIQEYGYPDVVLASPPCNHFSIASVYRHWDKDGNPNPETIESIRLVGNTIRFILSLHPRYWILENPRGMMRRVIGKPSVTTFYAAYGMPYLKPTDLWGVLPDIQWNKPKKWLKAPRGAHSGIQGIDGAYVKAWSPNGMSEELRALELRALVPYALSEAVCLACENGLKRHKRHIEEKDRD
jgi:hypothetical protein